MSNKPENTSSFSDPEREVSLPSSVLDLLLDKSRQFDDLSRFKAGASAAWVAACYIAGCYIACSFLPSAFHGSVSASLAAYLLIILGGLLFGAVFYLLSRVVYAIFSGGTERSARWIIWIIILFTVPFLVWLLFFH